MKKPDLLVIAIFVLILVGCGPQTDRGPTVVTVIATPTTSPVVVTMVASPTPPMQATEELPSPGAADALPSPQASPLPLPQEGFDETAFWDSFPLPLDAELATAVEGIDLVFTTDMIEPQVFDYYAAWLQDQGWERQAPTEAMITPPHQRWRKDVAELVIEIPGMDEAGRTSVWVQVTYLVSDALPQPTKQASDVLPVPATAAATQPPAPTAALPTATPITPANAHKLAEVRWTHVGRNTQDLAWSPAGSWLAVTESSRLYAYAAATLSPIDLPHEIEANSLAFSPDGELLAVTRYEGPSMARVDLWRVEDWTLARTLEGHSNTITDLAFNPDGNLLATGSMDASVRVWNVADGGLVQDRKVSYVGVHSPAVLSVTWHPNGEQVVAGVYGGSIQGWRADNGEQVINFQTLTTSQPNEIHFMPDDRLVSINGFSMSVWDLAGTRLAKLESEGGGYSGAVSPNGQLLVTFNSGNVELWDPSTYALVHRLGAKGVNRIAFAPGGDFLATLEGDDDRLQLWGVGEEEATPPVEGQYAEVWSRLGGADGRLGQPVSPAVEGHFVEQHFERGLMHWGRLDREGEPEPEVHVIVYGGEGGDNRQRGDLWGRFIDYWQVGDDEYSCPEAAPPLGPKRRFGLVWCQYVRDSLGAPVDREWALKGGYQDFEQGIMIWSPTDEGFYVLFSEGDWQFETAGGQ